MPRSDKKRQRLAALEEKKSKKKQHNNRPAAKPVRESERASQRRQEDDKKKAAQTSTAVTDGQESNTMMVYTPLDIVSDIYPWTEDDDRRLDDVVHELLLTNPRYKVGRGDVAEKMKEKTLMLDNPDVKRTAKVQGRFLKNAGVAKATRKELKALGALDVSTMGVTLEDAQTLHLVWKEYRDGLMESCVTKKDIEAMVSSMDKLGADIMVTKAREARWRGVAGIIIGDAPTVLHVIHARDGRHIVVPKQGTEYTFEIAKDRCVKICC